MVATAQHLNRVPDDSDQLDLSPLKLTAMIYIREALLEENYEIMAEIIECARDFGAEEYVVEEILSRPLDRLHGIGEKR